MGSHPVNLGLRFLLEVGALIGIGYWGYEQADGMLSIVFALGLPTIASFLWVIFAVPDDPSRSGHAHVRVPGVVRLVLELLFFGAGTLGFLLGGQPIIAGIFAVALIVHHMASYDRLAWLIKQ